MTLYYLSLLLALVVGACGYLYIFKVKRKERFSRFFYPNTKFTIRALYAITSATLFYFGIGCLLLLSISN